MARRASSNVNTVIVTSLAVLFLTNVCHAAGAWVGEQFARRTVYHSPQTPGYTCWVGVWQMPTDQSLMICFTQNTDPIEGRPQATGDVVKKFPMLAKNPKRDATGLEKAVLFMRSADRGASWDKTGEIPYDGALAYCAPGGQDLALKDGTILKGVFGYFLPESDVPQGAYLLRSGDGGKTWGKPQVLGDPAKETWRLTRMRHLRDGRIIATGGRSRVPSSSTIEDVWKRWEPLLIVSADDGRTWSPAVELLAPDQRDGWLEEWDTAELPNGDLLAVFRRRNHGSLLDPSDKPFVVKDWDPSPKDQIRTIGLLKKTGDAWALANRRAPFPHSGHPELLVTREGPILHIATTAIDMTTDAGETWTKLEFPATKDGYRSRYYPKAIQLDDGTIHVFGHVGSDDDYGERDQSIASANEGPLVCDLIAPRRRSFALGLINCANTLAGATGILVAGYLKKDYGLTAVFRGASVVIFVSAGLTLVGYLFVLPRDLRRLRRAQDDEAAATAAPQPAGAVVPAATVPPS